MFAYVNIEKSKDDLEIEIFSNPLADRWTIKLDSLICSLEEAKRRLQEQGAD